MLNQCIVHSTRNLKIDECTLSKSVIQFINVDPALFIDESLDNSLLMILLKFDIFVGIFGQNGLF